MNKKELRVRAINMLKSQSETKRKEIERKLTEQLIHTTVWENATVIGITMAQGFEWDTKSIIEIAWKQGKQVCVPKCSPQDKLLHFHKITSFNDLEVVYYNLLEPIPEQTEYVSKEKIDLLIVPGLLFNKEGFRVGFGGGYYDRFLTDFPNNTVSLLSEEQLVSKLPKESFDIPVKQLITENKLIHTMR
ncbi:5-formyltetrahydrofolate cyclo-ligase [Virgibacillus sp. SK37]|uniref:5-formyltetrahydrofolate cyclo-ligase n=1 Tax=Virgibacillus sp. SK37 TaxID=403957 RepID=UPI0004D0BFB7|nr:5-formyltetrahydrofolate cyclo-ligase [Virgibacillus sp. SK37]AIF43421.1 5-formyltetrahydrofolate cyclo-ligase [Virgibacillus sp. SK37]